MHRFLLAASLFIFSATFSQDTKSDTLRGKDTSGKVIAIDLSYSDSLQKAEIDRMASRSTDFFVQYQKQQREKQKKQAMLYIGLGVFFLIILIVGLRRRIKK